MSEQHAVKFRTLVEPPEPMRGLEIPPELVKALGGGARPPVTITVNGHSWRSRVAILRGRHLLGLSNADRRAAGVAVGEEVEVELALDTEPRVVIEPADLTRALDDDPVARTAYDRLAYTHRREHVRAIESAKKPETRRRRIEKTIAALRGRPQEEITMSAIRIHRYSVPAEQLDDLIARRAQAIGGLRSAFPGLTETRLIRLADGSYVDTWKWESAELMNAALEASAASPGVAAIIGLTTGHVVDSGEIIAEL